MWTFTRELQRRAILEGWNLFDNGNGTHVERIDSQDDEDGAQLSNDDEAIALAKAAGVPCDDDGTMSVDFQEEH
jgi:hypothetical protein